MKTKETMFPVLAMFGVLASIAAEPSVEIKTVSWNPESRRATVVYDVKDAAAVITADVLTNGVSIGGVRQWKTWGDVNRLIPVGDGRSFTWQADGDFAIPSSSRLDVSLQIWPVTNPPPYLAVDVSVPGFRRYYAAEAFVPQSPTNDIYRYDRILLRKIPAAGIVWVMGSPTSEPQRETDGREQQRRVKLSADYYIGVHEITQHQIAMLTGIANTAHEVPDRRPPMPSNRLNTEKVRGLEFFWPEDGHSVVSSSVIGQLRSVTGILSFDLPTSAQWEYAARAGSQVRYYWGDDDSLAMRYEWCSSNSDGRMRLGGLLEPNPWGLYDILGNNPELVLDWYGHPVASETPIVDPKGPDSAVEDLGGGKALRGGRYDYWRGGQLRSAFVNSQELDYDGIATIRPVCDAVAQ